MMDCYGGHMGGGGWALMVLVTVVLAVALIVGVVALLRRRDASPPPAVPGAGSTPERVLAERFARGEIEEAEYAGRLSALREQRRS